MVHFDDTRFTVVDSKILHQTEFEFHLGNDVGT